MQRLNKASKTYIIIGSTLILIGAVGVLFPYLPFRLSADVAFLDDVAEQVVETPKPFDPNRPSVKNRLIIPKAGVDMPIYKSENSNVLTKGGWIFPGTSTPYDVGNTVIFGHRFRYLPPISNTFYNLDKIEIGDEFQIRWQDKIYRYRVVQIKVIEPTDLSVLAPSDTPIVTLITCAPLFSTKQRLVVIAELI